MKITLNDGGYLEFQKSRKPHHVYVLIGARKADNPLELLVNSVEIPSERFFYRSTSFKVGPEQTIVFNLERQPFIETILPLTILFGSIVIFFAIISVSFGLQSRIDKR